MSQKRVQKGKPGTVTDGGPLSRISVFFVIFGDLMLRLTKLLLKSVLAFFYGKSSIFQFIRTLLSMRWFSMHQSLNEPPFVTAVLFNGRYTSAVIDDNKKDYEHCAIKHHEPTHPAVMNHKRLFKFRRLLVAHTSSRQQKSAGTLQF